MRLSTGQTLQSRKVTPCSGLEVHLELAQPLAVAPGLDDDLAVADDRVVEQIVAVAADDDVDAGDLWSGP